MDINRSEAYVVIRLPVCNHLRERQGELHAPMAVVKDGNNLQTIHRVRRFVCRPVALDKKPV